MSGGGFKGSSLDSTFLVFFALRRADDDCELDEEEEESLEEPELLSSELEEDSLCRFVALFLADPSILI